MLSTKFIRIHKISFSILIFLILFGSYHYIKPTITYQSNGAYRPFGVGYKHKTILPIWIIAILCAIFSYLMVLLIVRS
jgi:hypothetical protein